jgi:hypothetical protein
VGRIMGQAERKRRLKGDIRVSKVGEYAERMGMPGGRVVDPASGEPLHGNVKLSSLRDRHGIADERGTPRERAVRSDASVASGERAVERVLGLPDGSYRSYNRGGRDTRGDKRVGNHRRDHG